VDECKPLPPASSSVATKGWPVPGMVPTPTRYIRHGWLSCGAAGGGAVGKGGRGAARGSIASVRRQGWDAMHGEMGTASVGSVGGGERRGTERW